MNIVIPMAGAGSRFQEAGYIFKTINDKWTTNDTNCCI